MDKSEFMWLAGLLEGEGYFGSGRTGNPRVALNMTDEDVVLRALPLMQATHIRSYDPKGNRKRLYLVDVSGRRALDLMKRILPYMGERRSMKIRETIRRAAARPGHRWARHRTISKYAAGCRCSACRTAWNSYHREYRRKHPEKFKRYEARRSRD
jgi:hypothetical protein